MTLVSTPDNPIPQGAVEAEIAASDGVRLRTAVWQGRGSARGTVAMLGGRGEFIEKYFEVTQNLLDRRFCAVAMDWRGQGGSDRQLRNARKGHVDDFSLFERDLKALRDHVLIHCPRPWYALAHSMGAAVLLTVDAAGNSPFERLVLTSPMIAVRGVNHHGAARYIIEGLDFLGLGGAFAPGHGAQNLWSGRFEGNVVTTDPSRFARIARLAQEAPQIGIGGPTVGWTHAAFRAISRFDNPDFGSLARTPILIVAAGHDRVTETGAAERLASRMRTGRVVVIDGAQHEILIERDCLRDQFWAAFDAFIPEVGAAPVEPVR
jgi:lysophospholipase